MRIVIAECSAVYTGRGDTRMEPAVRAIIIKADGAISIHRDESNKPLNYMGKGNVFVEGVDEDGTPVWTFDTRKENLTITLHDIISDTAFELAEEDEGLIRDGTEDQLQEWLSENLDALGGNYELVGREFQTGNGPVDLLVKDVEGAFVAVEVKRVAMLSSVDQVNRYVEALRETEEYSNVRGMVAALDVRPKTRVHAEKKDIQCHVIDGEWKLYRDAQRESLEA